MLSTCYGECVLLKNGSVINLNFKIMKQELLTMNKDEFEDVLTEIAKN